MGNLQLVELVYNIQKLFQFETILMFKLDVGTDGNLFQLFCSIIFYVERGFYMYMNGVYPVKEIENIRFRALLKWGSFL